MGEVLKILWIISLVQLHQNVVKGIEKGKRSVMYMTISVPVLGVCSLQFAIGAVEGVGD